MCMLPIKSEKGDNLTNRNIKKLFLKFENFALFNTFSKK